MELLAPAGNLDSLRAAVRSGADAVYMGAPRFNARQMADNVEDIPAAISYAHGHGTRLYLTLNTLVRDRELNDWLAVACEAANAGVDAFIVQDLGGLSLLRQYFPEVPMHASTQMTVHNTPGALALAQMGVRRIVLARELRRGEITRIKAASDVELEVFVHGALCYAYSGQCLMSSMLASRSANRGQCAQPCRQYYTAPGQKGYLLSTKDLCLLDHLHELEMDGVTSLKIEGRLKNVEYVDTVTRIYRQALDGKPPTSADHEALLLAFNRGGFTDGMYADAPGRLYPAHPGNRGLPLGKVKQSRGKQAIIHTQHMLRAGDTIAEDRPDAEKIKVMRVSPGSGGTQEVETSVPLKAGARMHLVSRARADATEPVAELSGYAAADTQGKTYPCPSVSFPRGNVTTAHTLAAQVRTAKQAMAVLGHVSVLYVPAGADWPDVFKAARGRRISVMGAYPVIAGDEELAALEKKDGLYDAILHGGLTPHVAACSVADSSFNVMNSATLSVLHGMGFARATLSPELNARQMEDLYVPHGMQTEALVYGHLPLMVSAHCPFRCDGKACVVKKGNAVLRDAKNRSFPVLPAGAGCRVALCNAHPLYMADKLASVKTDVVRLYFTVESPEQCARIAGQYAGAMRGKPARPPQSFTRGHFMRGV